MTWALLRREKDHAGVSLGPIGFRNEKVVPNTGGSEGLNQTGFSLQSELRLGMA